MNSSRFIAFALLSAASFSGYTPAFGCDMDFCQTVPNPILTSRPQSDGVRVRSIADIVAKTIRDILAKQSGGGAKTTAPQDDSARGATKAVTTASSATTAAVDAGAPAPHTVPAS